MNKICNLKILILMILLFAGYSSELSGQTYKKITSDSELIAGKSYLIVYEGTPCAFQSISTTDVKYGTKTDITIKDYIVTDKKEASEVILGGSANDGWTFQYNSEYLAWSSGNSLKTANEINDNSKWTITVSSDNVLITNKKDRTRKLRYNLSFPRFACYSGSEQKHICLYIKCEDSPSLPPANLTFTPSEIELKLGETQVVEFTKATTADVTFTSSNEAVATFDAATNTVTAVGIGTTTITATSEENTEYLAGSATLTVSVKEPLKPADIAFTPSEIELKLGDTQVVEFTKATTADITFTSSNEAVATFDATTNTVTAVGIGTATITATSEENTEYLAGTAMLTVNVVKTFDNDIIFYESFDTNDGTGGNDGALSGTGSGKALTDNEGWNFQKSYGASKCIKLGTGSAIGTATTPPLGYTGTVSLTFRAGAWNYEKEEITLQVTVLNGGEFIENSTLKLAKGAFTDYQLTIKGLTAGSKIKFSAAVATNNRFFLDEVKVTKLHAVLDETATEIPANADVTDVTLKRTFNANKWNPVCLPFALSAEQITALFGAESEVAEYMGDEENDGNVTVKFRKKTDGMEANVPYLVYPLNNITEAEFSAVEVVATECPVVSGTVFDLVGNYTNQIKGSSVIQKGDYIVSGGVFKQANGGNGIKAFRSYLRKKPTSNAKSLMMVFQNETSGIDSIISNLSIEEDNCIYDLQGRGVKNPVKGLYIVNGRKVIIK